MLQPQIFRFFKGSQFYSIDESHFLIASSRQRKRLCLFLLYLPFLLQLLWHLTFFRIRRFLLIRKIGTFKYLVVTRLFLLKQNIEFPSVGSNSVTKTQTSLLLLGSNSCLRISTKAMKEMANK